MLKRRWTTEPKVLNKEKGRVNCTFIEEREEDYNDNNFELYVGDMSYWESFIVHSYGGNSRRESSV